MGLFSGLKSGGADGSMDLQTAVMVPIVVMAFVDGELADEEFLQIQSICAWSPIFSSNSQDKDHEVAMAAIRVVTDMGDEAACRKAKESMQVPLRETAFAFATRVAFVDGLLAQKEREALEKMIEWLSIAPERAKMIVDTVSIMQHPADVKA